MNLLSHFLEKETLYLAKDNSNLTSTNGLLQKLQKMRLPQLLKNNKH